MGRRDSTGKFRINLNAGLIISRGFSNYPLRNSRDEQSETKYSATPGGTKYFPGFLIGGDVLLRPREKFKIVLGLSFSQTSAEYHSSYQSEGKTTRPGFTNLVRKTENDYKLKFSALNFQAGVRNQLNSNFFLTTSLILNNPIKITRTFNGTTENIYTNTSGAEDRDKVFFKDEESTLSQKSADLSFRLNLEYQFKISNSLARVYIFRNFGLLYALPWWGLGISYTVKN